MASQFQYLKIIFSKSFTLYSSHARGKIQYHVIFTSTVGLNVKSTADHHSLLKYIFLITVLNKTRKV